MNDAGYGSTTTPSFAYRAGELYAEDVALSRIAEAVGTPFYCYSSAAIAATYNRFAQAFAGQNVAIHYAVKANSNLAVIRLLARLGAGADVVSEGELRQALAAGVPPGRVVFSGVGKTEAELVYALGRGIYQINVESVPELELLSQVAARVGAIASVALRINPDVDARTHAKISTGRKENKFGIDIAHAAEAYRLATRLKGVKPVGLAVHIGSQLTDIAPFEAAFRRLVDLALRLRRAGHPVERLDLGGGLGIRYRVETPPPIEDYAKLVRRLTGKHRFAVALEPGRSIVGDAGVLATRVLYIKSGATRRFAVVDAAMNDLIRPALYDAWHAIVPVKESGPKTRREPLDVVGPVCETGDTFALARSLPPLAAGDLLAIMSAGAYGAVMSSGYNSRRLVPEVLVNGHDFAVIRPRSTFDELLARDRIPDWLAGI